jgi:DNA-binding NarL/FixJ family response regulator
MAMCFQLKYRTLVSVGQDPRLLKTRTRVLQRTGAPVVSCSAETLGRLAEAEVGVVVLCHTLVSPQRVRVLQEIGRRWPDARVLQMVRAAVDSKVFPGASAYVLTGKPEELAQTVQKLLQG